jgi:uncharacterized protein (DUF2141 family)
MLQKQCSLLVLGTTAAMLCALAVIAQADAGRSSPASPAPATSAPTRSTLTVRIQGLRNDRGTVLVALYDNERSFAKKRDPLAGAEAPPKNRGAVVVFNDVKPGRYALAFFQDENNNKDLDTSLLGLPSEPFGFSRDAMGKVGPPSFAAAAIVIPPGPVSVVMNAKFY